MKLHLPLVGLLISLTLLSSRCKKQNAEPQLPPETTTGAMTFGCKVNGKVFVPKASIDGPAISVNYYYTGSGQGEGWFFFLYGANRVDAPRMSIAIETDSLLLLEGNSYPLKKGKGFAVGSALIGIIPYDMGLSDTGELIITKHNQTQRILSGRFSFTATNSNGEKLNITEGRFDVRY
jgi:hypothetical protein